MLMIPVDRLDEAGLRPVTVDDDLIQEIMNNPPEELNDNHRARQSTIETHIKTGKPKLLIRALRDLSWRERTDRLTNADKKLMDRIRKRLIKELSLNSADNRSATRYNLQKIIEEAMDNHAATMGVPQ